MCGMLPFHLFSVVPSCRFVSDDDRVALNVMHFGSPKSTGAKAYWALPQASPPAAVALSAATAEPRGKEKGEAVAAVGGCSSGGGV